MTARDKEEETKPGTGMLPLWIVCLFGVFFRSCSAIPLPSASSTGVRVTSFGPIIYLPKNFYCDMPDTQLPPLSIPTRLSELQVPTPVLITIGAIKISPAGFLIFWLLCLEK